MASTMKGLKFNLDETGLNTVFKTYQSEAMQLLFEKGEMTSGEVDKALKDRGVKISRASVIFFLNYMVDEGYLTYREKTGKGGWHRVYKPAQDSFADFIMTLYDVFVERLKTDLLGVIEDV